MPKSHITARIDENLKAKIDALLKKYPGLNTAKILEISLETFFNKTGKEQEKLISTFLLIGSIQETLEELKANYKKRNNS